MAASVSSDAMNRWAASQRPRRQPTTLQRKIVLEVYRQDGAATVEDLTEALDMPDVPRYLDGMRTWLRPARLIDSAYRETAGVVLTVTGEELAKRALGGEFELESEAVPA